MNSDDTDLTDDQGVDAGGTVDPEGDGRGGPTGTTETAAEQVDGTGNGALLSTLDQVTGGPGQEYSVGEGG